MQKTAIILAALSLLLIGQAAAHVTLSPNEAVAGYQTYQVKVPTEKDIPTTAIRLVIPDGVNVGSVQPVPGWSYAFVTESMEGTGDHGDASERIKEIIWSGGEIMPHEFMAFPISASYRGEPTTLMWKAYQTYEDGSVVAWDSSTEEHPAPKVTILKETKLDALANAVNAKSANTGATWLGVIAVLISLIALIVAIRRR